MKPNPSLIPRFNLDFNFKDFCYSINSIFKSNDFDDTILKSTFGEKYFFFTNYGRSALYVILKSLGLPQKSKIGVPLYSCTVVFDAIINAGFVPVFIDINDNYTLDPEDLKEKINYIEAVIVIHTFGRPADMDKIKEIAKGKPVIEDCAHSLLSEYNGQKTGTIGDVSYFSLAKYISIGGGSMIIVNNRDMVGKIKILVCSLNSPSMIEQIKNTFISYMRSFFYHKPFFGLFALPVGLSIENKVDIMNKRSFKITAINKSDLSLFLYKLKLFKTNVEIQRNNSLYLINKLNNNLLILPDENKNTYCNYYLFPIQVKNKEQQDKVCYELNKMGVDTSKLFNKTPLIAKKIYGYQGDCPNTEKITQKIITIPNHYSLQTSELKKIASSVKEVLS